CETAICT
ncbi:hypothetical protein, partial [Plasmodium yoelii yoelii]